MSSITNPPKQQRSRDSLERLLEAGLEVLETEGVEGFTISTVAKRAGVGNTLVYRRFTDKNDLLGAIFERVVQRNLSQARPAIEALAQAGLGFDEFVFELTTLVAAPFREHENVMRAFISSNRGDPLLARRVEDGIEPNAREFERALLVYRAEFGGKDPELAVAFCFQSMLNAFAALVTRTSRVHADFGWDTLLRQQSLMTVAYLRADVPK